jgi:hypothetical protein
LISARRRGGEVGANEGGGDEGMGRKSPTCLTIAVELRLVGSFPRKVERVKALHDAKGYGSEQREKDQNPPAHTLLPTIAVYPSTLSGFRKPILIAWRTKRFPPFETGKSEKIISKRLIHVIT